MQFVPYIFARDGQKKLVTISALTDSDAALTIREPKWQTDWTSDFIQNGPFEKYALRLENEIIAMAAYEI